MDGHVFAVVIIMIFAMITIAPYRGRNTAVSGILRRAVGLFALLRLLSG